MTDNLRTHLRNGRDAVQARTSELSASARETAEGATARIGEVYGQVRGKVSSLSGTSRDQAGRLIDAGTTQAGVLAATGRELGSEAFKRGRDGLDRAAIASRGLLAERPLTAVVVGIGAGIVLGLLANRLVRQASRPAPDDADLDAAELD